MENLHLVAPPQNEQNTAKGINRQVDTEKWIFQPSKYRQVSLVNEIRLTCIQRSQTASIFKDYDMPIPAWFKCKLLLNQRRRKLLNNVFFEAGVDSGYCSTCCTTDKDFWPMHEAWHIINGRPLCK